MLFDDFVNAHGRARSNTDQREMEGAVGVVFFCWFADPARSQPAKRETHSG